MKLSNKKFSFNIKHSLNYFVIMAFSVLMIILSSCGALNRSTVGLLSQIGYSIILAVSLNLVVGFLGELSLGHAGFMCVGAYVGCLFANFLHTIIDSDLLILIVSMIVGGCVAAFFGFIISLPALRLKGDYLAIVTLAFGEIVRNIFKNLEVFGGAMGLTTHRFKASNLFIVSFVVVLIMLFVIQNLIRSKHGRAITAIRDNEIAAKAMGINVTFYKLLVFVVSAFFAGLAGVIYGHYTTPLLSSFFSYNYSIEILVMVVLGGMGSINGSIIAATLIMLLNSLLQNNLSGDLAALKYLVYALVLIFMVLFNNAPAFKPLKNKILSFFKNLASKIYKPRHDPAKIKDDEAKWDVVPTKIKMDEVLSVDLQQNSTYTPDKPRKENK